MSPKLVLCLIVATFSASICSIEATKVQSNQMMESVSDLERDGNDVRMNNMNKPKDDEEQSDEGEDQDPDEDAHEDEDAVENEVDRSNMRSENENDGDNEDDEDEREDEGVSSDEIEDCSKSSDMCQMGVQPVGCYKDLTHNVRTLPKLLVTHRDASSPVFSRYFVWKMGKASIKRLLCECIEKARKMKMSYVALQFYGECWSSKTVATDYGKQGKSTKCVNGKYKPCKPGEFCVGKARTNYVYAINSMIPTPCKLKYKTVGCYYDPVSAEKRPLPYLLESNRDITSHAYSHTLRWTNYHTSLANLVCSCATKAHAKGYKYFGIQYFGECWSGPGSTSYKKYGGSNVCKSAAFQKCNVGAGSTQCLCTGDQFSNYVYQLG